MLSPAFGTCAHGQVLIPPLQIEKLFADPTKEIALPTGPRERTLRAPAEMMKNVQGSSSGAGSGEFHVYKQSRRREYERLRIMEDKNRAVSGVHHHMWCNADSVSSSPLLLWLMFCPSHHIAFGYYRSAMSASAHSSRSRKPSKLDRMPAMPQPTPRPRRTEQRG